MKFGLLLPILLLTQSVLAGDAKLIVSSDRPATVTVNDKWSRGPATRHEFLWRNLQPQSYDMMEVEAICDGETQTQLIQVVEGSAKEVRFVFSQPSWPEPEWHRPPDGVVYPHPRAAYRDPCCDEEVSVPWTCCDKWLVFGVVALLLLSLLNLLWFWLWWKRWHPHYCSAPGRPNAPKVNT